MVNRFIRHNFLSMFILVGFCILLSCRNKLKIDLPPDFNKPAIKHNYIILVDLSDRLIIKEDQPNRDIELIKHIFNLFEEKTKLSLNIFSDDLIRVVIAEQLGGIQYPEDYEDSLYINMEKIPLTYRTRYLNSRRKIFSSSLNKLYSSAVFSKNPSDFYGANIWKYFQDDLYDDISTGPLCENFLFILTDGYCVVGHDPNRLMPVSHSYPGLKVMMLELAPKPIDGEWDRISKNWTDWLKTMGITEIQLRQREALTQTKEAISDIIKTSKGFSVENPESETEQSNVDKLVNNPSSTAKQDLPDYSTLSLQEQLNILSDSVYSNESKKNIESHILTLFQSPNSSINIMSEDRIFTGTTYSVKFYLTRLRINNKYQVEVINTETDNQGKIITAEIIEQ
jgi:hypothetical protein